jgi:hypothetical protein
MQNPQDNGDASTAGHHLQVKNIQASHMDIDHLSSDDDDWIPSNTQTA